MNLRANVPQEMIPQSGMLFKDKPQLFEFVQEYVKVCGFQTKNIKNSIKSVAIRCTEYVEDNQRARSRATSMTAHPTALVPPSAVDYPQRRPALEAVHLEHKRPRGGCGCNTWKVNANLQHETNEWKIALVCLDHQNHQPQPPPRALAPPRPNILPTAVPTRALPRIRVDPGELAADPGATDVVTCEAASRMAQLWGSATEAIADAVQSESEYTRLLGMLEDYQRSMLPYGKAPQARKAKTRRTPAPRAEERLAPAPAHPAMVPIVDMDSALPPTLGGYPGLGLRPFGMPALQPALQPAIPRIRDDNSFPAPRAVL